MSMTSHRKPEGVSSISFHTCARILARACATLASVLVPVRPRARRTVEPLGAAPSRSSARPGTRTAGMPLISPRVQALLSALCVFRLLPHGFTNRDLRTCLAPLLGLDPEAMTSGQLTYDLRRLRIHGLIQRIPHTFRYQVTPAGLRQALFLTRLTQHLLIPGLAQLTDPSPPAPSRLRAAARAYDAAIDDLTRHAGLAA